VKPEGRTTRALRALPAGAIYVVAHRADVHYCKRALESIGRPHDTLEFITLEQMERGLRARPRSTVFDVDHAAFSFMSQQQRSLVGLYARHFTLPPIAAAR
jgi:hypothetical protein